MQQESAPPITRYDYQEMPPGPPYYQVIEGDLVMAPSPDTFHQDITRNLCLILGRYLETHPIGEVYFAPLDVYLGEHNVYQPDVMFVSKQRRSIITPHGLEGAPDLVVEILSASTAGYDRGSKRKVYARTGVKELWLVDPALTLVQVYHLARKTESPVATHSLNSVFRSPLLPGLKISTAAIFRSPLRR